MIPSFNFSNWSIYAVSITRSLVVMNGITEDASRAGFSRGVAAAASSGRLQFGDELESLTPQGRRFAAVYHLISYAHNRRLRLRVFAAMMTFRWFPPLPVSGHRPTGMNAKPSICSASCLAAIPICVGS